MTVEKDDEGAVERMFTALSPTRLLELAKVGQITIHPSSQSMWVTELIGAGSDALADWRPPDTSSAWPAVEKSSGEKYLPVGVGMCCLNHGGKRSRSQSWGTKQPGGDPV